METAITPDITIKEEILDFPDSDFLDSLCNVSEHEDIKPPQTPEIGSRNSAFQPYKVRQNLILINLCMHCIIHNICMGSVESHWPINFY